MDDWRRITCKVSKFLFDLFQIAGLDSLGGGLIFFNPDLLHEELKKQQQTL